MSRYIILVAFFAVILAVSVQSTDVEPAYDHSSKERNPPHERCPPHGRCPPDEKCPPHEKCPLDERCPPHERWDECGTLCEPTCDKPCPRICPLICQTNHAGCRCIEGYVRDTENRRCVPRSHCRPCESAEKYQ